MNKEIHSGGDRYSWTRFKRVMQTPKLNVQEAVGVTCGAVAVTASSIEGAYLGTVVSVLEDKNITETVPLYTAMGTGVGLMIASGFILPIALNRGWDAKYIPQHALSNSSDTTSKQIKDYLRESWKRVVFRTGSIAIPLASSQAGLLTALHGHSEVGNALIWAGVLGLPVSQMIADSTLGIKRRK